MMSVTFSAALFAGCAKAESSSSQDLSQLFSESQQQTTSAGTILLSVNPEILMDYDAAGNVVSLSGMNEDGKQVLSGYTNYEGRPCKEIAAELVNAINAGGYFDDTIEGHEKNIVLKVKRGSQQPSEEFLNEVNTAVQTAVNNSQIGSRALVLDDDDYDDAYTEQGYLNKNAVEEIVRAQFGSNDIQFIEKDYDLDDGEYEVEFVLNGIKYEYEVNAVTGKVTEMDMDSLDDDDLYDDIDDDRDDLYDDIDDDHDDLYDDIDDDRDDLYDDIDDDDKVIAVQPTAVPVPQPQYDDDDDDDYDDHDDYDHDDDDHDDDDDDGDDD